MKFKKYTVEELVQKNMLEKPLDGNHGNKHPKGSDYTEQGIPFIMVSDISNGRINYNTCKFISKKQRDTLDKGFSKEGDVLLSHKATIGITCIVDNEYPEIVITPQLTYYRVKKGINNYYLKYYFDSPYFQHILKNWATSGSTRAYLGITAQLKLPILLPDIIIQNKIATMLQTIDRKIELNNQINDNLHDLAEQIFFEIYKNGRERTLGDLLENISTGARPKGGAQNSGIPSFGAERIERFGIYDYSSEKYIAEDFYEKLKNGKMNSGDVLLYKDGAYTGKVSMCLNWFPHKKSAVNEHVFILNTENNWAQNYLYFTLYNKQNKEMLERLAGAKAAQPGLNQTELKSLKINICDKEFIKKFENEVKPIMESIANNSLENKKLVELRDTLLPKLMNGEINLDKIEI